MFPRIPPKWHVQIEKKFSLQQTIEIIPSHINANRVLILENVSVDVFTKNVEIKIAKRPLFVKFLCWCGYADNILVLFHRNADKTWYVFRLLKFLTFKHES